MSSHFICWLCIVLQLLSCHQCLEQKEWSLATKEELTEAYFSNELCSLQHNKCPEPVTSRSRMIKSKSVITSLSSSSLSPPAMMKQCQVGFVKGRIIAASKKIQKKQCKSRGFKERSGLLYSWKSKHLFICVFSLCSHLLYCTLQTTQHHTTFHFMYLSSIN
jgi:hypothetical protein